ncbi:MAG: NAD(P)-binding protein [Alphaproteobacteria bacterium]|jgi:predicted NAD/FAD-dependent oxidoreductase|nr:NAD(P)-binding protein [Alphaproteobacteria bacterium]
MPETVAIIGAGMAGLSCAQALTSGGHAVQLFDKGRGPGGRMSTRRASTPLGDLRWDHGAQFFTARSAEFIAAVEDWQRAGLAARWPGTFMSIGADGRMEDDNNSPRFVGIPTMNSIIRGMAAGQAVEWGARVVSVKGEPGRYGLLFEDGREVGPFSRIVVAVPAEQVGDLIGEVAPEISRIAATARSAPSWTVMLAFETRLQTGFDAARISAGPLGWVARNASKPGRDGAETWVLQASADWSQTHIEAEPGDVADDLLAAFRQIARFDPPVFKAAHRWRYARVERPAPAEEEQRAAGQGIFACGDWARAPRIEAAWLSGRKAGERLMALAKAN